MTSEQIVTLTKMLTESLIAQQKAQMDFQKQMLIQQERFETLVIQQTTDNRLFCETILSEKSKEGASRFFSAEGIANSLSEFKYDPEKGDTFPAYYRRFETIFTKRCEKWLDEKKITLLLQKMGTEENTKFTNLILPKKPEEISFSETVKILCVIFGERDGLFHTRYRCLNMSKDETDDIVTYAGKVNAQCELFKLKDLSVDMFKCYIFVQGLTAPKDKDLRSRILSIMEQDPEMNLQKVTEECQKLINVKRDTTRIEGKVTSQVQVVKQKTFPKDKGKSFECWSCAGPHLRKNCPYKDQRCTKCGLVGHRASHCRTKQDKRRKWKPKVNVVLSKEEIKQGGKRKFVHTQINGHSVKLLLDTGSDISIIDEVTWKRIGGPKLRKTQKIAKGVSGERLKFRGEFNCSVSLGSKLFPQIFQLFQE